MTSSVRMSPGSSAARADVSSRIPKKTLFVKMFLMKALRVDKTASTVLAASSRKTPYALASAGSIIFGKKSSDDRQVLVAVAKHRGGRAAKPLVEEGRINPAEIDGEAW